MESIGQYVFDTMLQVLTAFTGDYFHKIVLSFKGIFNALVVLYIIFMGFALLTNRLVEHLRSMAMSLVAILVCNALVFETNLFAEWVYMPLRDSSLGLTSLVLSPTGDGGIRGIFAAIDASFTKIFVLADKYADAGSGWNFIRTAWIFTMTLALTALFSILYAVFVGLLLIGMFSFHVMMLAAGPAILLAGFPFTRHVFWAWLRACFNYALIPVFTAVVMAITLYALDAAAKNLETLDPNGPIFNRDIATVLLIGLISIWFHLKAPEFAATLTGGTSAGGGFFGTLAGIATGGAALARGAINAPSAPGRIIGSVGRGFDAASQGIAAGTRAYSRMKGIVK